MPSVQTHRKHQAYCSKPEEAHIGEGALLQQDRCAVLLGSSQALSHAALVQARKEQQMWLHMPQTLFPVEQDRARHFLSAPAMYSVCRAV